MKSIGGNNVTTPVGLLEEGKVWLEIWRNIPKEVRYLCPATYCLLTALELHMKAYLVLKNNTYADIKKLKKIGHSFKHIYQEIVASGKNKLTNEINTQIKKYELEDIALDKLKYPEDGRMWSLSRGFEKGEHTLDIIFQDIDREITTNFDKWLNTTYPKRIEISATIQMGYKGNPKKVNLKSLSNTCSECLPANIFIFENYSYPWRNDQVPFRVCKRCKKHFNPNGMRPSL